MGMSHEVWEVDQLGGHAWRGCEFGAGEGGLTFYLLVLNRPVFVMYFANALIYLVFIMISLRARFVALMERMRARLWSL
jgi:hypothetical protein